ncbi:hypothetical protein PATA110616_11070 [Paenibacillus tarimensis]
MDDDPGEPSNNSLWVLVVSQKGSKASFYLLE